MYHVPSLVASFLHLSGGRGAHLAHARRFSQRSAD
jgi:hypothetical protein